MIDRAIIDKLYKGVKLSQTENEVMEYLVNHIDEAIKIGIRGVAQKGYTSTATVIRLSKKLGFDGFKEMTYSLKNTLSSASGQLPDALREEMHFVFDRKDVAHFFDILDRKGFICVHGQGYSRLIAEYLEKKLISSACTAISQDYLEADTIVRNFHHKLDTMIIISKSGNNPFALEAAKLCQQAKIPTIVFTGNPQSDLKKFCNTVFVIKDNHPFDIENAQSNYFFGYCILEFEEMFEIYHNRT